MGKSIRNRIMLNRRRDYFRKINLVKNEVLFSSVVCMVIIVIAIIAGIVMNSSGNQEITKIYKGDVADASKEIIPNQKEENSSQEKTPDQNSQVENNVSSEMLSSLKETENEIKQEEKSDGSITFCLLGQIMMGGEVSTNLDYIYTTAFKDIFNITKSADFTFADFTTNITNLEKIQNAKSKYIVTKDVMSGLLTLGIDAVSIANDHIVDYPKDIITNTITTLEKDNIYVAGRKDTPVYLQKQDKKIAIIATNSVYIGTKNVYSNHGISTYQFNNLKQNIKTAKENADFVIVDIHWGREYIYGVTNDMKNMAHAMIDAGADMIIGSHAMGIYPIIEYKDKPIIYSTGYLMSDSDSLLDQEGFIFNIKIAKENTVESIELIPTYIENKTQVKLYSEYNIAKTREILNLYNRYHLENGLNSKVFGNRNVITF